jgi:hypothetical protein
MPSLCDGKAGRLLVRTIEDIAGLSVNEDEVLLPEELAAAAKRELFFGHNLERAKMRLAGRPARGARMRTRTTTAVTTVLTMAGLTLPKDGVGREHWTDAESLGVEMLNLAAWLTQRSIYEHPKDERKGVWIDEAFFLSEVPTGRVLMNRFARDSRKWNVRVLLSPPAMPPTRSFRGIGVLVGAGHDLTAEEAVLGREVALDVGEARDPAGVAVREEECGQPAHRVPDDMAPVDLFCGKDLFDDGDQERDGDRAGI